MPFYKIYKALLWLMGFESGEFITYLWRRQAKRLGVLWWLLVASTQGFAIILLDSWHSVYKIPVQFVVCLLIAVIFWHVATGTVPD
jgi:hypothetical protein